MKRQALLYAFFIFVGIAFIVRLFFIQVLDNDYQLSAENQAKRKLKIYPPRGSVYDRNGKILISNQPAYDLMVVNRALSNFDTLRFCEILSIDKTKLISRFNAMKNRRGYSSYKPNILIPMLSKEEYASVQEHLNEFKGITTQIRILRDYPYKGAANVVGFIGEVSDYFIKHNPQYQQGDLMGKGGIDKSYENELKGKHGVQYVMVDNHNRIKGSFHNGKFDTLPEPGAELTSTIDLVLQKMGEEMMRNKRGSIVAIEPATGEILAMVSAPGFDPNLLVGNKRSANYNLLYSDSINKPLFDRGLLAQYPPGSPFKVINALIALQEKTITPYTTYTCHHGFHFGRLSVACHCSGGPMALRKSISKSCNNYYCTVFKGIVEKYKDPHEGMDVWSKHVQSFGLGNFLNNDLPTGTKGLVPDAAYYDRVLGYTGWRAVTTISLGIGQGELLLTPIQMANMTAAIANRGFYFTPHIVKAINGKPLDNTQYTITKKTTIEAQYFEPVIDGMFDVFEDGTARGSRVDFIQMCGKTGTAENPHGQDHSIFIAFAPKDNPKIAIAITVENGYWGSRWGAPMASLMIEQYLTDSISRPKMYQRMVEGDLRNEYRKQAIEKYGTDSILKFD